MNSFFMAVDRKIGDVWTNQALKPNALLFGAEGTLLANTNGETSPFVWTEELQKREDWERIGSVDIRDPGPHLQALLNH